MTEFEQQVAAALTEIVSTWIYRDGVDELRRLWRPEEIAPRVAAAIEAGIDTMQIGDGPRLARAAGLNALRGAK